MIGYGTPVRPPYIVEEGVAIDYEGGTVCDEDKNLRYNSTISFLCNPTVFPGKPVLGSNFLVPSNIKIEMASHFFLKIRPIVEDATQSTSGRQWQHVLISPCLNYSTRLRSAT